MTRWLWLPVLLTALTAGCVHPPQSVRSTNWLYPFRPGSGPSGSDVIIMDVALLERPVGDRFLNQDVWTVADEQMIALDRKAVLEDNGLQIGQLGGLPPPGLQALLTSERSCVNPRRITLRSGSSYDLLLGPAHEQLCFERVREGRVEEKIFDAAQCVLVVTPTLTDDGRTLLRCTPQVRHGQVQHLPQPAADLSGWVLQAQQATETYTDWTFEVSLATNEYVVIGGRANRPTSLGCQCFVRVDETNPVQRLLVIRTGRMAPSVTSATASEESEPFGRGAPPLAVQAAYSEPGGRR